MCVCAKSLQSCLTLYNPMDCSSPGSSVHRILKAKILEWVTIFFSRDQTRVSCVSCIGRWGLYYKNHLGCPYIRIQISSVQSLSLVWFFATPWTATCWSSLSITNSRSLLTLVSIETVMPSNHLIVCRPLLLPPLNIDLWFMTSCYWIQLQLLATKANVREASVCTKEKLLYLGVQQPGKKVDSCSKANSSLPISA